MEFIFNLNSKRNEEIILQVNGLNDLLLANNIIPIFLKGTGNLVANLYNDIAERMVGDIDFIVSKIDYPKAIEILLDNGYFTLAKDIYPAVSFRHFPRLIKEGEIAAVEIHKELIIEKFSNEFNHCIVQEDSQKFNNISLLSFEHQLSMAMIANQINDNGFSYKNISIRNAYDVFLLSKKTNAKRSLLKFKMLGHPLNCFLATCYFIFDKTISLEYLKTKKTAKFLNTFNDLLLNKNKRKFRNKFIHFQISTEKRLIILYKSSFNKGYRAFLFKRIQDRASNLKNLIIVLFIKIRKYIFFRN